MVDHTQSTEGMESARRLVDGEHVTLRLYVAGTAHHSARAVERVRQICADCLPGRYQLDIVDLYLEPYLAQRDQIVALPTLIKTGPLPTSRVVGDMSDTDRVLRGLGIIPDPPTSE